MQLLNELVKADLNVFNNKSKPYVIIPLVNI